MRKFILVEKYTSSSFCWLNLVRKKNLTQNTIEEVIEKYQGFEGDSVTFFSINELNNNITKIKQGTNKENCFLLHISNNKIDKKKEQPENFIKIGYDFGVCEEEKTIYSSIFNEILFGSMNDLVSFIEVLNESLLFPNRVIAEKYANLHQKLLDEGDDVEAEDMSIYEVWKYNSHRELNDS